MKIHKSALYFLVLSLIALGFVGCDKDFVTIESDVITDDIATNFDLDSRLYDVITYTQPLGPVQTNGLDVNGLGIYNDVYGTTTAHFLSQLTLQGTDPDFGEEVSVDSVVLRLPFFASVTSIDAVGNISYSLDSVYNTNPIKLTVFESNYFLRDFDPNGSFDDGQNYFSNKSASLSEAIPESALEGEELQFINGDETSHLGNNLVEISNETFNLTQNDINDPESEFQLVERTAPGIRIKLDTEYWTDKIMDSTAAPFLASQSAFNNYLRGLYIKAELVPGASQGSYLLLNTASENANITIFYSRLTNSTNDDPETRERATFTLDFGPIRTTFLENNFTLPINQGDADNGDSRLYLKGGEGSIARIKLFNGENSDDQIGFNEFEVFKSFFVEEDENGELVSKRLVNEANLVFYVDQEMVSGLEPDRLYVYDIENKIPLIDYTFDVTNNSLPSQSKTTHLGPLQRVDDEPNGQGVKYKLRITNHINNLLLRDSTNVELGLAVALNVNSENPLLRQSQQEVLDDDSQLMVPISSVMSPKGTILHGNATEDENKRVYLEIFYAEPNN